MRLELQPGDTIEIAFATGNTCYEGELIISFSLEGNIIAYTSKTMEPDAYGREGILWDDHYDIGDDLLEPAEPES